MGYLRELQAVGRDIGSGLLLLGCAALIPMIIGCAYQEWQILPWMAISPLVFFGCGAVLKMMPATSVRARGSLAIALTAMLWLVVGIICAFPFMGMGLSWIDAAFESMSAWTGTGFSVITNIEAWPHTLLFWRSFMQWIGGLGIVAFALTVAGRSGLIGRGLYNSEGRSDALMPGVIGTAMQMWKIYAVLTVLAVVMILLTGVGLWDAVNLAFCAISTGGMAMYTDGVSHYGNFALEMVLVPIMLLGAMPFRLYYFTYVKRSVKGVIHDKIFQLLLGCFAVVSAYLIIYLMVFGEPLAEAIRQGLFMTATAISTTGFQNTTMAGWGAAPLILMAVVMLIGGGPESTAGGIKLSRIQVMFEALVWWFKKNLLSPRAVISMRHNNKPLEQGSAGELIAKSLLIILLYMIFAGVTVLIFLHDPYFSANVAQTIYDVCSCFGCNGSSAGLMGPMMPEYAKVIVFFLMWIARLEIIPVLILLRGLVKGFGFESAAKVRNRRE